MTFDEFKTDALRTESKPEALNFSRAGLMQLLVASVAMAKIIDTAKKTMFYGKPLDAQAYRLKLDQLAEHLQNMAQRTDKAAIPEDAESHLSLPNLRIAHGAIGMFGEAGELLEAVIKQMTIGEIDMINVGEELGDSFWYAAIIADETGISFDQAQETVVAKLKARYGEKFTNEAALNRDLEAERTVLEAGITQGEQKF